MKLISRGPEEEDDGRVLLRDEPRARLRALCVFGCVCARSAFVRVDDESIYSFLKNKRAGTAINIARAGKRRAV